MHTYASGVDRERENFFFVYVCFCIYVIDAVMQSQNDRPVNIVPVLVTTGSVLQYSESLRDRVRHTERHVQYAGYDSEYQSLQSASISTQYSPHLLVTVPGTSTPYSSTFRIVWMHVDPTGHSVRL